MKTIKTSSIFVYTILSLALFIDMNCTEKSSIVPENEDLKKSAKEEVDEKNTELSATDSTGQETLLFIGTYSSNFYVYKIDTSGSMAIVCSSPTTSNPSYLSIHPNKKWVYAVNENNSGTLSSFSFDTTKNQLTFLNSKSTDGSSPCYVSIDNTGRYVMVANYNSGNVIVFPIKEDGSLGDASSSDQHTGSGPVAGRQGGPHAHMIIQSLNNYVYSNDLGADKIFIYKLDDDGRLSSAGNASTMAGAGPRHIDFHKNGKWAFSVCEISGTVESYIVNDTSGQLTRFQSITTLAQNATNPSSADIHISPDGRFLYASNRGSNNNIAIYSIDQANGELTLLGHQPTGGNGPRSFIIENEGKLLIVTNQNSNSVNIFKIDPLTGMLSNSGKTITISKPVCVKFIRAKLSELPTTGIEMLYK